MGSSSDSHDPIEMLAEEFLARRRRGEVPTIAEYIARFPDREEEIKAVLGSLAIMEEVAPVTADIKAASIDTVTGPLGPKPERLGDYRILREIGRGGMGVVYEAEQESLGRRVALKVLIQKYSSDNRALGRFRREAQAAARLHHTNIVPVFEVGQEGDTVFYAMQFIQGQSVDKVLAELRRLREGDKAVFPETTITEARRAALSMCSGQFTAPGAVEKPKIPFEDQEVSPPDSLPRVGDLAVVSQSKAHYFRSVARFGEQVASALSYAHDRGTIHRDIKPSNLLVDASGVVWVADFGLAKFEEDGFTRTGDIVGTLRYMSPERFQGKCDARADVYALGATLYEMLLLKPAFESSDHLEMMDKVANVHPRPPRVMDPQIPLDLETIVMKAMEKEPGSRFQSAQEMGEDLARFLRNEPIRARRVSPMERLARWTRRNPAVATLTGAVFLLLCLLVVGAVVLALHERAGERETWRKLYLADVQNVQRALERNSLLQPIEEQLGRYRAGSGHEHLRGWEWYYLWRSYHEGAQPEDKGTSTGIVKLAVSPDGSRLAKTTGTGTCIELYNLKTFQMLGRLGQEIPDIYSTLAFVSFSGDGNYLAYPGTNWKKILVRDFVTGKDADIPFPLDGNENLSVAVFHPISPLLAAGTSKGRIYVYNTQDNRPVCTLVQQGNARITALAFSGQGGRLGSGSNDGEVLIWDTKAWKVRAQAKGHLVGRTIYACAFSPSGNSMATACQDRTVKLWNAETGGLISTLGPYPDEARAVTFSEDGKTIAVGVRDRQIRLWDTVKSVELESLRGYNAMYALSFIPRTGSQLVFGNEFGAFTTYHVGQRPSACLDAGRGSVGTLLFVRDRNRQFLAASSADQLDKIRLWEVTSSGEIERTSLQPGNWVRCFAAARNGTWAFCGQGKIGFCQNPIQAIKSWQYVHSLDENPTTIAFSDDSSHLAIGYQNGMVWVYGNEKPGRWGKLWELPAHGGPVTCMAFDRNPKKPTRLVTGSTDKLVRIWSLDDGQPIGAPLQATSPCESVAFSPQGDRIAVGVFHGSFPVWDWPREEPRWFKGHEMNSQQVAFLPDGLTLVTAGADRQIKLWDPATGQERFSLDGKSSIFTTLAVSPDGLMIAAGSRDGTVRLYRRATNEEVAAAGW